MALNAGDMLYYDGSEWVNSSTLGTAAAGTNFQIQDTGTTNLVRPIVCSHTTSGTIAAGFGTGIQFATNTDIGDIDCHVGATSPLASFLMLQAYYNGTLTEVLRLGSSTGASPVVYFPVPLIGLNVPFQLGFFTKNLGGGSGTITLNSGEYRSPIIQFTNAGGAATIVFPSTAGGFWILHNNSGQLLTLSPSTGPITIANGKRAVFYADGTNIQRVTPDT
jgi:hypothetical protein